MNAERLLEHYEKIAEAPDAIPKLRRFILDLAVRGKLVPQDPHDEPAAELLKRIEASRSKSDRRRRVIKNDTPSESTMIIPTGWELVCVGEVFSIRTGYAFRSTTYSEKGILVFRVSNFDRHGNYDLTDSVFYPEDKIDKKISSYILKPGEIIMVMVGGTLGKTTIVTPKLLPALLNQNLWRLRSYGEHLDNSFEYLIIRVLNQGIQGRTESTHGHYAMSDYEKKLILIPPLAEQQRIVAKVDELMGICDRLEVARKEREAIRDGFTTSTLGRLSVADESTFRSDASFAIEHLRALTTRPDQIKQLRQTILNLAVRGKLVPQDPNDEPASELLKRIAVEKSILIKSGEIKEKPRQSDATEVWPYALPRNWVWVRLSSLAQTITKGSSPKWQGVSYVNEGAGLLFITSENVGNYKLRKLDELKFVENRFRDIEPRSMLKRGDLLINLVGASIGRTAIYDLEVDANINQAVGIIRLVGAVQGPYIQYLLHYLNSQTAINLMLGMRVTTAQPNMSLTDVKEFPIPLPPFPEQHRIVAKIDQSLKLCDHLESRLDLNCVISEQLMKRLLFVG